MAASGNVSPSSFAYFRQKSRSCAKRLKPLREVRSVPVRMSFSCARVIAT